MKYLSWILWGLITVALSGYLGWTMLAGDDKTEFLIGETTDGHHQIELSCSSCHTSPFGGTELLQKACEGCHLEELTAVRDSHPRRKFTDPANADRVAILDARVCVTCHREHQEDITGDMAVTVPADVCFLCHEDVGEDRPSHAGLPFDGCASSGCHNFHDNTALYEDFLVDNAGQPWLRPQAAVPALTEVRQKLQEINHQTLGKSDADAPAAMAEPVIVSAWSRSGHASTGINCSNCHQDASGSFLAQPDITDTCSSCHESQNKGFLEGRHGMRLAAGLSPLTPSLARIPMHESAAHQELSCISCHGPHEADRQLAAVDACRGCHDSEHVNNFEASPHGQLFADRQEGRLSEEAGVSCATCHMPRIAGRSGGRDIVQVEHNQNANLRPSDKMLRSVCMHCHSLEFSIDALADELLVRNNFSGKPSAHIESVDMAVERHDEIMKDRDTTYH